VKLETRKVADLVPADYNPRTISPEALAGLQASIRRWGIVEPIIVNERTGRIVGGHQRLKALAADGEPETPVVVVDLPEVEEKALNVALNSQSIAGEFTPDLGAILDEVEAELPDLYEAVRLDALALGFAQPDEDEWGDAMGGAGGDPDGPLWKTITLTMTEEQHAVVNTALDQAAEMAGLSGRDGRAAGAVLICEDWTARVG